MKPSNSTHSIKNVFKMILHQYVSILAFFFAYLLIAPVASAQQVPSRFSASVVKIDITPDDPQNLLGYGARLSTGTNDPIFHKIIALDDGSSQFFLISSDICLVSPSEYD